MPRDPAHPRPDLVRGTASWLSYVRARRVLPVAVIRAACAVACATVDLLIPVPDPEASVFLRHAFPTLSLLLLAVTLPEPLGDLLPRRGGRTAPARATSSVTMELVVFGVWVVAVADHADAGRISTLYALGLGAVYALATVTPVGPWVVALAIGSIALLPGRVTEAALGAPGVMMPASIGVACLGLGLFVTRGAAREPPAVR